MKYLFSNKDLRKLIVPLIFEQALAITVGMADTMMISSVGEAAVSGVSLVDMVNMLIFSVLAALATGGAVVTSQFIGAKKPEKARLSVKQLLYTVIIASLLHDVCKADMYMRTTRRRKTKLGDWEDSEGYRMTFKNFPMGHGEKSLVLVLCSGLEMNDDEMLAIRWHMGAWGVNMNSYEEQRNYDASRTLYPLVTIIQTADGLAAAIMERGAGAIDEL